MRLVVLELVLDLGPGDDSSLRRGALWQELVQRRAAPTDARHRKPHDVLVPAGELDVESVALEPAEELAAAHATPIAFHARILLLRNASSKPVKKRKWGGGSACAVRPDRKEGV
jgi:predicted nucleic acid-binding Zn ribbon protein